MRAQIDRPYLRLRYRSMALLVSATPIFAQSIVEQGILLTEVKSHTRGQHHHRFQGALSQQEHQLMISDQVLERALASCRQRTDSEPAVWPRPRACSNFSSPVARVANSPGVPQHASYTLLKLSLHVADPPDMHNYGDPSAPSKKE